MQKSQVSFEQPGAIHHGVTQRYIAGLKDCIQQVVNTKLQLKGVDQTSPAITSPNFTSKIKIKPQIQNLDTILALQWLKSKKLQRQS